MVLMTRAELLDLVLELRSMAQAAPTAQVRDALDRLADRYAARLSRQTSSHIHCKVATSSATAQC